MAFIITMAIGLLIGWLAGRTYRNLYGLSTLVDLFIGLSGAMLGAAITAVLFDLPFPVRQVNLAPVLGAVLGAVLLMVISWFLRRISYGP